MPSQNNILTSNLENEKLSETLNDVFTYGN